MEPEKLKSVVESILFVSGEPMAILRLAKVTDSTEAEIEECVTMLMADYVSGCRGLRIVKIKDTIQLVTNPENAEFVAELVKSEIQENLSQSALEVLSIIAYRGPVTRTDIEAIRGVNCSFTLRALLIRGLIERTENIEDSRRYLYSISFDFLRKLGLDSVEKLPDWEKLSKKMEEVGESLETVITSQDQEKKDAPTVQDSSTDELISKQENKL